ncbi:MAG: bacteriohemerythrin [Trichloromonas sp.]|jgi:hemerythrin|nr:bacteriohemerythrin [Trichloromonas sp.]
MEWTEEYAVGQPLIDSHHRQLFERFNALISACRARKGREEIARLYDFLDEYVHYHFSAEEALMAEAIYPDMDRHQQQHQEFIKRLRQWQSQFEKAGASFDLLVETNEALFIWLIQHIRSVDMKLARIIPVAER